MIRKTLARTKAATFLVLTSFQPNPRTDYRQPAGTGFFVSPDGYFITAHHVVASVSAGEMVMLKQPLHDLPGLTFFDVALVETWPKDDLALLKARPAELQSQNGSAKFPYLQITYAGQEDGTPVYSFGYPLSDIDRSTTIIGNSTGVGINQSVDLGISGMVDGRWALIQYHVPSRVTSAIIAARSERYAPTSAYTDSKVYVIDKALNYGNSGGPIVTADRRGEVIAVCKSFQPTYLKVETPNGMEAMRVATQAGWKELLIPSLYGVTASLQNIQVSLRSYGIPG